MLILAGVYHITDELKSVLCEFDGGVICDGLSGLYDRDGKELENITLADMLGIKFEKFDTKHASAKWGGYLNIDGDFMPTGEINCLVTSTGTTKMADLYEPCTEQTDGAAPPINAGTLCVDFDINSAKKISPNVEELTAGREIALSDVSIHNVYVLR